MTRVVDFEEEMYLVCVYAVAWLRCCLSFGLLQAPLYS